MGAGASATAVSMAEELLGAKLLKGGEEVDTKTAFEGKKAVALYFSAHWCPPCKGFTPKLAEFYKNDLAAKGLEVVFVSSDRDEAGFKEYFAEMPWLALPYGERELKEKLSKKFKVQGIPSVVILNAETGDVITTDGRSAIMSDPKGAKFPWIPPTFAEALPDTFLSGEGTVEKASIAGKTLGLYFSAHWCPPCRGFTPQLAAWYKKMKPELGDKFEIIFCSGDRDEAGMKSYYKEQCEAGGDWLCLPYAVKDNLDPLFKVNGIPTFIIVSPEGKVINQNGRSLVPDGEAKDFPFAAPLIGDLENPENINEKTAICLMLEAVDAELQKAILAKMAVIAKKYSEGDEPEFVFYAATKKGNVSAQIRGMCGLEGVDTVAKNETSADDGAPKLIRSVSNATPSIILMDIPDNGGYYVGRIAAEMDGSNVEKMIADYKEKKLERKQMG